MSPAATNGAQNGHANGYIAKRVVRVGIIGCGEIAQVVHIPTLNLLSDYYQITYLCDVSDEALAACRLKVPGIGPKTTRNAEELCSSSEVDAVLVCNATAFHAPHAILALEHDKHVFVEKPLTVCFRDIDAISAAEEKSHGSLFVGYMRRYAPGFLDALAEIGDPSQIQYARVRDIIGANDYFVRQSGTFPKKFSDYRPEDVKELTSKDRDMIDTALVKEFGVPSNDTTRFLLFALAGLGSHDLSVMREVLGMPLSVSGVLRTPIWSAVFEYGGFSVAYESGVCGVPIFDCHIEVFTPTKIVRVNYDTPYIKGLPTTMTVREKVIGARGEETFQERTTRPTYEDSYTLEHKEWYQCIVAGVKPKCGAADSRQDIEIYKMLMQASAAGKPDQ